MSEQYPTVMSWSGGKDSALALHYLLQQKEFDVRCLLTTINEHFGRIAMHGVRKQLLIDQATQLNMPLVEVNLPEMPDMEVYENAMGGMLSGLAADGITQVAFGDIFLEDLKLYREQQLGGFGLKGIFPLWGKDTREIMNEFIDLGFKTVVVCAQDGLKELCGQVMDRDFIKGLPKHIDPCGENGEFHTFVFDGPIFRSPIVFKLGELVCRSFPNPNPNQGHHNSPIKFWYRDLM
ncbi:MAG: ATP-binding protein [Pedobacter sp.]|nr:ATP-binding protein [Pedobacter sp.]MDQ8052042.1 ATP-binding protein [Pedobacter sp.]